MNCTIYWLKIYNPGPQYEIGWHTNIGMTTKLNYEDRIEEHKTEAKPNNRKFDIIRQQTDRPWQHGIIKQWRKPFNSSKEGLAFMAEDEKKYIKEYQTYNTIYGLNNSIGGDYSSWPTINTSGMLGISYDKFHKTWMYVDPYDSNRKQLCKNKNLRLLLYQLRDQYGIEPIILDEEKYKKSLEKSDKHIKDICHHHYYCGSSNISISRSSLGCKKEYIWVVNFRINGVKKTRQRTNTFDLINDYGYLIYTHPLFAYMAIGLENEWLVDNYTVDQSKFMSFNEFEKKYIIKDNNTLKKVIKSNLINSV